jgi:hypothetical protein
MASFRPVWKMIGASALLLLGGDTFASDTVVAGIADRMTHEALAAGAAGDVDVRDDLLDQALRVAPDHAPAHWARGEMLRDGEWISIGAIQEKARADTRQQEYQAHKAEATTPAAHLELAKWCDRHSLTDEARYHWLSVLSADPQHKDALRALDCTWVNGQLVTRSMAADLKAERRARREAEGVWRVRIAGWDRALASGGDVADRALADVEATVDESAIPEFEKLAATLGDRSDRQQQRTVQLCESYLMALGRLPSYEATSSLTRFAVLANNESLRSLAAEGLQSRPDYEYVPALIEGLASKLESRFSFSASPQGVVSYDHEIVEETQEGERIAELSRTGGAIVRFGERQSMQSVAAGYARGQRVAAADASRYMAEAANIEQQVAWANQQRSDLNGRIIRVLETTTGQSLGDDPAAWREYWSGHNGVEFDDSAKPSVTRFASMEVRDLYVPSQRSLLPTSGGPPSGTTTRPPPEPEPFRAPYAGWRPPVRCECFAEGTLVWTKTGMQEIETLGEGDLVLTMDEQTGERSFRPVLRTTLRPPGPMMHLEASNYQIVCTPGHPFWVEGTGWRMAKELSEGDRITTATGAPLELRSVASAEQDQQAFNLVVEGNNNYFVGQDGLLSHDNTERRPELARAAQR